MSAALTRINAILRKELRQILRDRATLAMIIAMPVMLMILFGYAINTNPRHLPAAIITGDSGPNTRALLAAAHNTAYLDIRYLGADSAHAATLMQNGQIQFILHLPPDLEQRLARGHTPQLLLESDGTDPASSSPLASVLQQAFADTLAREHPPGAATQAPLQIRAHLRYNPELITRYQIVPGLIGIILTITTIMLTGMSMTREHERGTMENLLATPLRPIEVMSGKILPYLLIGYAQTAVILAIALFLFQLPMTAQLPAILLACGLFMLANLGVGFTFSTLARNQMQVMQMTYFFFLPSILLSGFMFPYAGLPVWAQRISETLPITHFLRIMRGLWLKNTALADFGYDLGAIALFLLASTAVALWRYRRTLD